MSTKELRDVARKAVSIFSSVGLYSCLVGGVACELYGTTRTPNDVDLVVMSSIYDTEELKRILVRHNGDVFYLRPSKKRGATYKLLFAKLGSADGTPAATPGTYYGLYSRSCKVDILIPGIMNIPSVESSRIVTIDGLPLVPLLDYRQKQYTDISDLTALLAIAVRKQVDVRTAQWLPESFLEAARGRVSRYIVTVPSPQARLWREIGFRVDSGLSDSGGLRQRYLDSNRW